MTKTKIGGGVALGGTVTLGGKRKKQSPVEAAQGERAGDRSVAALPAELTDLQRSFRERSREEEDRRIEATDSEFWVALCFENREQKEEFLRKTGLLTHGDKYLDGRDVAATLGVELEERGRTLKLGRVDRAYADLVPGRRR